MLLTEHSRTLDPGLDIPEGAVHSCRFSYRNQPVLSLSTTELGILSLPSSLVNAVPKRQAEFLAGRYCALVCCHRLGFDTEEIPIQPDRSPAWPERVIGSITHSQDRAASIVVRSDYCQGIGLDIEPIVSGDTLAALRDRIANREEVGRLASVFDSETAHTLLFSAKEAIYKAIYPTVKRFVDFDEVSLLEYGVERLNFQLGASLRSVLAPLTEIQVRFTVADSSITTVCVLPRFGRPAKYFLPRSPTPNV